jgi:nucleoside-diphosphate-sugar epimerase
MRGMKVLITGATGFIGSHAAEALSRAGHELRVFVRSREKLARVMTMRNLDLEDVHVGDMADSQRCLEAMRGCDAVLHTAASVTIGRAGNIQAQNASGNRNFLGQAAELGLDPILYTSSVAALFPPRGPVFRVDDPIGELESDYGLSKTEGESYVRELQTQGVPLVSVYPAGVYGPDDPGPGTPAIGIRDRLRFGWFITQGGTGCVDVRDLATLWPAVLETGRGPRRYMAGGHFITWAEEADICERLTGRRVRRIRASPRTIRAIGHTVDWIKSLVPSFEYPLTLEAARYVTEIVGCDNSATTAELGVRFRPTEDTLRDTIVWMVESGILAPRFAGNLAGAATRR